MQYRHYQRDWLRGRILRATPGRDSVDGSTVGTVAGVVAESAINGRSAVQLRAPGSPSSLVTNISVLP